MKRFVATLGCALAFAAAVLPQSAHAIMTPQSVASITAESSLVIRGTVTGTQAHWTPDRSAIVTEVTVSAIEVWAGDLSAGASIRVTVRGGEAEGLGMFVEDQPRFRTGEDALLFLRAGADGAYVVAYDVQGKFGFSGDEAVASDGRRYGIEEFREAVRAAMGPATQEGNATFPEGEQGPPVNDDNNWSWCGIKWFNLPYTWFLHWNGSPGCTFAETEFRVGMGFWTWMCNSGVSMNYGGGTWTTPSNHDDRTNVVGWVNTLASGTIALCTYVYWVNTGEIIEIDIEFNAANYSWSCNGSATAMDVQNIATHEVGHTLCLGDLYGVNDSNKTMYGYSWDGDVAKRTLLTADVLGAEWIYPHSRANFTHGTPAGWSAPVVPRATADAGENYAPLPALLYGNDYSYLNQSMWNNGADCASPSGNNNIYLDAEWAWGTWWGDGVWGAGVVWGPWRNLATWVRGGRHSLTSTLDDTHDTEESNEGDNRYDAQYVWSPLYATLGAPNVRYAPPDRGFFAYPNSDGFSFTRNSSYAWVTAVAPHIPGDDYDLYVYDDFSGSTAGYSNYRGGSAAGGNYTDFVVGNYFGTPTTLYPAAVRYGITYAGYVSVDQIDASNGRNAFDTAAFTNQTMGDYRLADVYEGYLTAGVTYHIALNRVAGSADIAFNVYPGVSGGIYGRYDAQGFSYSLDANRDVLDFTPSSTGWHPIVVFRNDGTDESAVTYNLHWNLPSSTDEIAAAPRALTFDAVVPNPTRETTRLSYQLPSTQVVSLDLIDLSGRRIRNLVNGTQNAGASSVVWDGRTDDGQRAPAGLYWARLRADGETRSRLVTVVK